MADSQIDVNLFAAFSPTFKTQTNLQTALSPSDLTKRLPLVQPSKPSTNKNKRTIYHCNGIDIIEEKIGSQFSRWSFGFPASAQLIAGFAAMSYGAAQAPTGAPQDEVQTVLNAAATAGTFTLTLSLEGRVGTTKPIAFDATAADVRAALEAIAPIESGDITVTGTLSAGFVVTFIGRLAKADVSAMTFNGGALTGGTLSVTETTKGANKFHAIARAAGVAMKTTSFIIGFEGDATPPLLHKGFGVDALIVEGSAQEDLTCSVELVGSAETEEVLSFVVPVCTTINPIEMKDCRAVLDGNFINAELERVRFERRNNIPVGKGAFPWDSPDIALLWRGSKPTEQFTLGFYGSRGDANYTIAANRQKKPFELRLGNPGDRCSIIAPNTLIELADADLTFDNGLRRSVVNVIAQPFFDETINASTKVEATIAQTTAFLLS